MHDSKPPADLCPLTPGLGGTVSEVQGPVEIKGPQAVRQGGGRATGEVQDTGTVAGDGVSEKGVHIRVCEL